MDFVYARQGRKEERRKYGNMTILLQICAVSICVLWLAWFCQVSLSEAIPVFICGLVLALYGLAMLRHLSWIDGIAVFVVVLFAVWMVRRTKADRTEFCRVCRENVLQPSFLTAAFLLLAVALCTSGKAVSWWDDINFWAADVKSLYFLDGFAGKYANVAPEFGDYPPGAQLFKWWFLHFNPAVYCEGLAFAGYYTMNMAFLLPLLRKLKGCNVLVMVFMAVSLWLFPSIAEVYGYDGFCADLTMACIYGGFLSAVTDRDGKKDGFYYGRLALYLGVLVLVKSIGFVWALFGILFLFLYSWAGQERTDSRRSIGRDRRGLAAALLLPVLTGASWFLFCLAMRRVTRTTATAVKYMTTDEYGISGYTRDFAKAFIQAFVGSPLHKDRSIVVDLTPLGLYICVCFLVFVFYKIQILPKKTGKIVLWFSMVSGMIFYGIIFVAHITIFATETQYLEASGMISSIERYGAPFTIGTLILLADIWLDRGERFFRKDNMPGLVRQYGVYLCFLLFVALTAGYGIGYHGLVGYRGDVGGSLKEREEMIGEEERLFLDALEILGSEGSGRVCYIRRDDAPRWVNNSYTSYEAAPVSVTYRSVNLDDAPTEWMVQEIRDSHAAYLYVEETDADAGNVFGPLMQGEDFQCGMLYLIEDDGAEMKLTGVAR